MPENELKLTVKAVDEATKTIEKVKKSVAGLESAQERAARIAKVAKEAQAKYVKTVDDIKKVTGPAAGAMEGFKKSFPTKEAYQQAVAEGNRLTESIRSFSEQAQKSSLDSEGFKKVLRDMAIEAGKAAIAFLTIRKAVQAVMGFFRDSVGVANQTQKAFINLSRAASAFGISAQSATDAAFRLSEDGLINVMDSASEVAQLLRTGLSLEDASTLLERWKDIGAASGETTKNLTEKIVSLNRSFITNRTQTAKQNGLLIDFSTAERIGAEAIGKKVNQLTEAERVQARYLGIMEATNDVVGAAADYTETYEGKLLILSNTTQDLERGIGAALIPTLGELMSDLTGTTKRAEMTTQTAAGLAGAFMAVYQGIKIAVKGLITLGNAMWEQVKGPFRAMIQAADSAGAAIGSMIQHLRDRSFSGFGQEMNAIWDQFSAGMTGSVTDWMQELGAGIEDIVVDVRDFFPKINKAATQAMEVFGFQSKKAAQEANRTWLDTAKNVKDKVSDILKRIEEENERYQESLAKTKRNFEESLRDMVIRHRDKRFQIEKDIEEETKAFLEASRLRKRAFREEMADIELRYKRRTEDHHSKVEELKKDAEDKKREILKKEEEETKQIKINLLRQLSASHDRDETLIEAAKKRLTELKKKYEEETQKVEEELKERLSKEQLKFKREVEDHKKTVETKERNYEEETKKSKQELDKRITEFKAALSKELAIWKKYQSDFDKLLDAQIEDDITRLKRRNQLELKELNRLHEKRLKEIRNELNREAAIRAADAQARIKDAYASGRAEGEAKRRGVEDTRGEEAQRRIREAAEAGRREAPSVPLPPTPREEALQMSLLPSERYLPPPTKFSSSYMSLSAQGGAIIPGQGAIPVMAHGGETILTRKQTQGLLHALEKLAEGQSAGGGSVHIGQVVLRDDLDVDRFLDRVEFRRRAMA